MNRAHPPCSACAKFSQDHCEGFDRPAQKDDAPCVLFVERGSREAARDERGSAAVLAGLRQRHKND